MRIKTDTKKNLSIILNDNISIDNIYAGIDYEGDSYNILSIKDFKWNIIEIPDCLIAESESFKIVFYLIQGKIKFFTQFKNNKFKINHADKFIALGGIISSKINRCMINSFTESNGIRTNEMQAKPRLCKLVEGEEVESSDNIVLGFSNTSVVLFGALTFDKFYTEINISQYGKIEIKQNCERKFIDLEQVIVTDKFYCSSGDIAVSELIEYTKASAKEIGINKEFICPSGFCTWYYYGPNISSKIIYENIEQLKRNKTDVPIKYIQIDDGWQDNKGFYEPNQNFDNGMKNLANKIKTEGYQAGIWLSPFKCNKGSEVFLSHKNWLVKNWDDNEIYGYPSIDYSIIETKKWLYDLFHKISYDWGYKYIKIDLILGSIAAGRHCDASYNSLVNYKEGLRIIRNAISKDTFLLCCTAPIGPSVGFCDGMRIGIDIFERWSSLKNVAQCILRRFYYNNIYFRNDSDCVMMRDFTEEDEECFRFCTYSDNELDVYQTLIACSGGSIFFSDKQSLLKQEKIKRYSYLFPLNLQSAIPLDYEENQIPEILDFGTRGKMRIVAFFNWSDIEKYKYFNVKNDCLGYEFWSKKIYNKINQKFRIKLLPHSVKLFCMTEYNKFMILGSEDSLIPQLDYTDRINYIEIVLSKCKETIIIYCEYTIKKYTNCELLSRHGNIYRIKGISINSKEIKMYFNF